MRRERNESRDSRMLVENQPERATGRPLLNGGMGSTRRLEEVSRAGEGRRLSDKEGSR